MKNNTNNIGSESEIVNLKTRGFLIHPNNHLYKILQMLEISFCKHANSKDVFDNTYNETFLQISAIPFPCSEHKYEVITDIFTMYIIMRMRQYTYLENQKEKKNNRTKKKLSKLVSS